MGRLFWKLFFGLSITLVLVGAAIGGAVYLHDERQKNEVGFLTDRRAEFVVGLVSNTLRYSGLPGVRALLHEWPGRNRAPTVMIVDGAGRDAFGQHVPPAALHKALAALQEGRDQLSVKRAPTPDGGEYVVFLPAANADTGPRRPPPPELQILIALCASLLFSAGFATYLSRPIRHLRHASNRIAEGHLDTRVSGMIGSRNDELSDLGKDFDAMAQHLQTLLNAQMQLLHDVSHELRSPVARMRLAVGLAQQQPEKAAVALARIERETERLDELLGQMLTLARLESGFSSELRETVSLDELLGEIIQDVGFEAQAMGRAVDYRADCRAETEGQRELLRRAFENVIRNALKHGSDGGPVEIRLAAVHDKATVTIRDHGPGIAPDKLETVFQPFYHLPTRDKTQTAGYGLGLAIARRALDQHTASITLENAAGGGLLVSIVFQHAVIDGATAVDA